MKMQNWTLGPNRRRKYQNNEDDFQLKFLIFTKLSISMDTQITSKQREAANEQSFTLISRKLVIWKKAC